MRSAAGPRATGGRAPGVAPPGRLRSPAYWARSGGLPSGQASPAGPHGASEFEPAPRRGRGLRAFWRCRRVESGHGNSGVVRLEGDREHGPVDLARRANALMSARRYGGGDGGSQRDASAGQEPVSPARSLSSAPIPHSAAACLGSRFDPQGRRAFMVDGGPRRRHRPRDARRLLPRAHSAALGRRADPRLARPGGVREGRRRADALGDLAPRRPTCRHRGRS